MEDSASVRVRRQGCLAVEAEYMNNTDISEPRSTTDHIAHVASLAHPPPLHLLALHLLPLIVCSVGSPSTPPSLLHSSTPLNYIFITVVGLLVQGSIIYTRMFECLSYPLVTTLHSACLTS